MLYQPNITTAYICCWTRVPNHANHKPELKYSTAMGNSTDIEKGGLKGPLDAQENDKTTIVFWHPLVNDASSPDTIVGFDGPEDLYNPLNWSVSRKIFTTFLYGLTTCWITFSSAVYAAGIEPIAHEFDVPAETSAAGVSLIVFGYALGFIWAPVSEVYGRKWVICLVG